MVGTRREGMWWWAVASLCCGAALLWSGAVAAQPVKVKPKGGEKGEEKPPEDTKKQAAKIMFQVAGEAFKSGHYQEALDKLQEVYKLDPNPIILYNIARAYEELGRLAEAAEYFQRAVSDPTLPQNLQAEVGRRLPKVLPALKFRETRTLTVRSVTLSVLAAEDRARQAALDRQKGPVVVQAEPSLVSEPFFWGGVGAEVVGLGLLIGAVLIDQGLSEPIAELQDEETRRSAARTRALQSEIDRDQLLATVFYAGGGLLALGGGVLLYLAVDGLGVEGEAAPGPELEAGASSWRIAPLVTGEGAGLSLGGTF